MSSAPFLSMSFSLDYPNYKRPLMMLELLRLEDWRNWGSPDSRVNFDLQGHAFKISADCLCLCHSSAVTSPHHSSHLSSPVFFINSFFSIHTFFPFSLLGEVLRENSSAKQKYYLAVSKQFLLFYHKIL